MNVVGGYSTASKNFIGIVEGEQRTADQSTSNLRLNEIGVPWLFHPCSLSFSSICQLTSESTKSPAAKKGRKSRRKLCIILKNQKDFFNQLSLTAVVQFVPGA